MQGWAWHFSPRAYTASAPSLYVLGKKLCVPNRRGARESVLERWCVDWWRARGYVASKLTNPTGIMDRVFWVPGGRPLLVEFKDPKGKTAKGRAALQAWYRKKLSDDGYRVAVVRNREEFLELVKCQT